MNNPIISNISLSRKSPKTPISNAFSPYKNRDGSEISVYYLGEPFRLLNLLRCTPEFPTIGKRSMKNRTRMCMKFTTGDYAQIREFIKDGFPTNKHFWSSVHTCKSIHLCPICGPRLRSAKSDQIQKCINCWLKDGGSVSLITLTFSHSRSDCLIDLTDRMKEADNSFSRHRSVKDIKSSLGLFESIKNLEFTWGEANGWHPHTHQLWFTEKPINPVELKKALFPHWKAACIRRGLKAPNFDNGLDIRSGESAADYLAKSGIKPDKDLAKEITHGHRKIAKGDRLTPMGIASLIKTDPLYMSLWCEYAVATHRKHFISRFPKLQNLYNLTELTDSEVLEGLSESVMKSLIHKYNYRLLESKGLLYEALEIFNLGGTANDLNELIKECKNADTL